jgi:hypothetical protein
LFDARFQVAAAIDRAEEVAMQVMKTREKSIKDISYAIFKVRHSSLSVFSR